MSVNIRPATEDDIDAMYAVSCAVHLTPLYQELIPEAYRQEFVSRFTPSSVQLAAHRERSLRHLASPEWFMWVAEDRDGTICGFTSARQLGDMFKLKGLFVDAAFQGQGIGRRLFDISCDAAPPDQPIVLDVIAQNRRAVEMYLRAGFQEVEAAPDPYYGAPMIRMQKY